MPKHSSVREQERTKADTALEALREAYSTADAESLPAIQAEIDTKTADRNAALEISETRFVCGFHKNEDGTPAFIDSAERALVSVQGAIQWDSAGEMIVEERFARDPYYISACAACIADLNPVAHIMAEEITDPLLEGI